MKLAAVMVLVTASLTAAEGERDVMDRPLAPLTAGRPALVIFSNRETRDTTAEPSNQMALRLTEVPYVTVVRVDLRGVPGFIEGFARSQMRDAYVKSVEHSRKMFADAGLQPALRCEDRLAIVADSDGITHEQHGLAKGFRESIAVVVDPSGHEVLEVPFPREREKVEAALKAYATPQR